MQVEKVNHIIDHYFESMCKKIKLLISGFHNSFGKWVIQVFYYDLCSFVNLDDAFVYLSDAKSIVHQIFVYFIVINGLI